MKLVPTLCLSLLVMSAFAVARDGQAADAQAPVYTPGLGEIMSLQQMRHSKLWSAGSAHNWPLAAYELDELKEGFDELNGGVP